jgi:hypothetical protein
MRTPRFKSIAPRIIISAMIMEFVAIVCDMSWPGPLASSSHVIVAVLALVWWTMVRIDKRGSAGILDQV